uniref:Uncharacterized protein n=1 Tax=Rhizophora mucronata TaxID=61149 RepID=A0A2P2PYH5_RHIMU
MEFSHLKTKEGEYVPILGRLPKQPHPHEPR